MELAKLDTEKRNERTMHIDTLSTLDMVTVINEEDHRCAEAVRAVLPEIARSIDVIYAQLRKGGRLFYCGAGTSGRLGVLDAAECPPTYGVDPGLVVALIAGGESAFIRAIEGAEDNRQLGADDLKAHNFSANDALVGIAASGRTPYVIGAMDYARSVGAPVMALTCCSNSEMSEHADITMAPIPGPEVVTGSSRMKSGTCQKLVLNAGANENEARQALDQCGWSCKTAIVMLLLKLDANAAAEALRKADGRIAAAVSAAGEA